MDLILDAVEVEVSDISDGVSLQLNAVIQAIGGTAALGGKANTDLSNVSAANRRLTSLEAFGCHGDGVADDTLALQAAMTLGGLLPGPLVATGTYLFTTLTIPSGVVIEGMGVGRLKVKPGTGPTNHITISAAARLQNLIVDGNSANVPYGYNYGLVDVTAPDVYLDNVNLVNAQSMGLRTYGAGTRLRWTGGGVNGAKDFGIFGMATSGTLSDLLLINCSQRGIRIGDGTNNASGWYIVRPRVFMGTGTLQNPVLGIEAFAPCDNCIVENPTVSGSDFGVSVTGKNNQLLGGTISNTTTYGVELISNTSRAIGVTVYPATGSGISVNLNTAVDPQAGFGVEIEECAINNVPANGKGIVVATDQGGTTPILNITGNSVLYCAGLAYDLEGLGAGSVVSGNSAQMTAAGRAFVINGYEVLITANGAQYTGSSFSADYAFYVLGNNHTFTSNKLLGHGLVQLGINAAGNGNVVIANDMRGTTVNAYSMLGAGGAFKSNVSAATSGSGWNLSGTISNDNTSTDIGSAYAG